MSFKKFSSDSFRVTDSLRTPGSFNRPFATFRDDLGVVYRSHLRLLHQESRHCCHCGCVGCVGSHAHAPQCDILPPPPIT